MGYHPWSLKELDMTEQECKTRGPAGAHRGGQGRVGPPGRGRGRCSAPLTAPSHSPLHTSCSGPAGEDWRDPGKDQNEQES